MIKIGILSVSDTRKHVHEGLAPYILECQDKIKNLLESDGEVQAIVGTEIINSPKAANEQGQWMQSQGVNGIIFNIAIFSFPNLTLIAANAVTKPIMMVTLENPKLPGLVGLLANTGFLRQNGYKCTRVWGNEQDPKVKKDILAFAKASYAVSTLKGQVFGVIGGRSIGMGTGAANPNLLMKVFGVDVEHADQSEILRRSGLADEAAVEKTYAWLKSNVAAIAFDGDKLTPESLREQIRYYYAIKSMSEELNMDFVGVKCHIEMSAYSGPPCLACALSNDPYDCDGLKESVVFACESDCDGALSMQILKLISGKPSFLVDVRYCDLQDGLFTFCNCGSVATWYAGKSDNPAENLRKVRLVPIIPKYTGKGCHVQFITEPGEMTFCRLTHTNDQYEMLVFKGMCVEMPEEKLRDTAPEWPHMFIKVGDSASKILENMNANHIHGTTGNRVEELAEVCRLLDIKCIVAD